MRQAYKLIIVLCILPQTTDGNSHAIFQIPIQLGLGPVIFLKVMQELLRCRGKLQSLGNTGKLLPALQDFFLRGLLFKGDKDSGSMTILNRNTQALGSN